MSEFSRSFRVTFPDGEVWHGVQFPSGRCVLDIPGHGFDAALSFDALDQPKSPGAVVEWADGGQA